MKKNITLLAFLFVALTSKAQLPVGSWYTGACIKLYYYTENDHNSKNSEFQFYPATFYTLNEKWGVGGGIYYDMTTSKTEGGYDTKYTTSTFGFEPAVRYYGKISDRVNCYAQGGINIAGGTSKSEYDGGDPTTYNNFYWGLEAHPGIMWNIKSKTYLDFSYGSLNYTHSTSKQKDTDNKTSDDSFLLNLNTWTLGVALYYVFGSGEDY